MSTIDEFKRFLHPFRVDKTVPATFTCINPSARLHIPDESLPELFKQLKKAYANGVVPTLTEKPKDPSPLRIDLDFRFPIPTHQELRTMRNFDDRQVEAILRVYYETITEYMDAAADGAAERLKGYVMMKPTPVEFRSRIKDGIHIIFPHLVVSDVFQHLVRRRVLERAGEMFAGMTLCNNAEDVVDEAIISKNNWLMYGCSKPDTPPYKVTSVATWQKGNLVFLPPPTADEEVEFIELFSMRNKENLTPMLPGKADEVREFGDKVLPSLNKKRQDKIHERIFSTSRVMSGIKASASAEDFELARRLVRECLSPTRAESYEDWIQLGWCLRNIDHRLLESWVEFSRVSSKYVDGECQRLWNSMRCDGLSMGTLRMWAKTDNKQGYNQILDGNVNDMIDKAKEGAHYDVAKVVHSMYKDKYRFISKDIWYVYDENRHRWVSTRDGHQLRKILSDDVVDKFVRRSLYWGDMARAAEDEEESKTLDEKKWKLLDVAKKLKMANYKSNILTECKSLFTDEKFEERLDSARHLIGFENGVYDLSLHEFRDGQPDDFISFSTGVHYVPYNPASLEAFEIDEFISKVLRNPNVKQYVKDIFAMSLDGSLKQERFYIFTGSGSNGKSALCNLFQQSFGEYCCILPISLLTQKRAASNSAQSELERTKGRRFSLMQEPSENEKMNIGLMKELTGGDKIMCRGLFKEPIEFRPQFKMILCCNDLPEIPSDDGGTWRRIRVIEFNSKFTDSPNPGNPAEFKADIQLNEKFERWTETFISMLIAHHKTLDPKNLFEPEEVTAATQSYRANNDIIGQWFVEAIIAQPGSKMKLNWNTVVRDFKEWYKNSGGKAREMPERQQIHAYVERHIGKPNAKKGSYTGYRYFTPSEMTLRALQEEEDDDDEDTPATSDVAGPSTPPPKSKSPSPEASEPPTKSKSPSPKPKCPTPDPDED